MSWWGWVKSKLSGKSVPGGVEKEELGESSDQRKAQHPGKHDLDRKLAQLNRQISAMPDGPKKIGAYFDRGVVYKELGDLDNALADFARVVEVVPAIADVHAHRGECFLRRRDHELALDSLDRAIALLPIGVGLAVNYLNRGKARAAIGELEAALADFAKAVEIAPEAATVAREEEARVQRQRETEDKAPGAPIAHTQAQGSAETDIAQGWERDAQGDRVGALVAFGKAIERNPNASAFWGRGVANCKLKRYPEAIADLNRALDMRPRFAAALTERGLAYVNSGEVARGLADYDRAITIDPTHANAYLNKAVAYLNLKRWAEVVPCLDVVLRLIPKHAAARYSRGLAYEKLGDLPRAIRDFQDSVRSNPTGPHVAPAEQRVQALRERVGEISEPAQVEMESLWTVLTGLSHEMTVAELVQRVHAEGVFFGQIDLPDGGSTFVPFYGKYGIQKRLTEIADVIGPRILTLKIGQVHDLLPTSPATRGVNEHSPASSSAKEGDAERLVEGSRLHVLTNGDRVLGVLSEGIEPHDLDLPTVLFGERPIFGRSDRSDTTRRCWSCGRALAYFDAVLEEGKLAGYACPHCSASPILAWVEERMRPGRWSRSGFLGETEALPEIITKDDRTLARLELGHAQIANALDHLLAAALLASTDRIARATLQFEEEMRASKMQGLPGLGVLPLGPSLNDLEHLLQNGSELPMERGTSIDGYDVFLEVYLGYQYCPFTRGRVPWSDDVPPQHVVRRRVGDVVHLTSATDCHLPCDAKLSYRYGNLEFLIVRKDTRQALRGSGLMVHLIRDHQFFEGEQSPFRLDPEQAVQVLGLRS